MAVDTTASDPAAPIGCVGVTTCSYEGAVVENAGNLCPNAAASCAAFTPTTADMTAAAAAAAPAESPRLRSTLTRARVCELCRLSVKEEYAGLGIGTMLVNRCEY